MDLWRAGCAETCTSGSEGGPRRRTEGEPRHRASVRPYTYVPTWEGWLFLAVVVDACSRRVCGCSMRDDLKADLVVEALGMATTRRRPGPGLIHHSDRGGQHRSLALGRTLRDSGILASMGSRGDAFDNAAAESFMASIKTELTKRQTFKTRDDARLAVFSTSKPSTTRNAGTQPWATYLRLNTFRSSNTSPDP
jgi:putative transposase